MFKTLDTVAEFIQICGGIISFAGVWIGVLLAPEGDLLTAIAITIGCVLGGLIVYGYGGALRVLVLLARNSERKDGGIKQLPRK